jgi:hypothetical protein
MKNAEEPVSHWMESPFTEHSLKFALISPREFKKQEKM